MSYQLGNSALLWLETCLGLVPSIHTLYSFEFCTWYRIIIIIIIIIIIQVTFYFHVWYLTTVFTNNNALITATHFFLLLKCVTEEGNATARKKYE